MPQDNCSYNHSTVLIKPSKVKGWSQLDWDQLQSCWKVEEVCQRGMGREKRDFQVWWIGEIQKEGQPFDSPLFLKFIRSLSQFLTNEFLLYSNNLGIISHKYLKDQEKNTFSVNKHPLIVFLGFYKPIFGSISFSVSIILKQCFTIQPQMDSNSQ